MPTLRISNSLLFVVLSGVGFYDPTVATAHALTDTTHTAVSNSTEIEVQPDSGGASGEGESTQITYTDRSTNASKTVPGGTLNGLGQGAKVKIDPVPNTTVTVTNTSDNLSTSFTAAIFNPPLNRVVSKYTILSGSIVQFGAQSFTVSGTYTLVDTTID